MGSFGVFMRLMKEGKAGKPTGSVVLCGEVCPQAVICGDGAAIHMSSTLE